MSKISFINSIKSFRLAFPLLLLSLGCVDRIDFNVEKPDKFDVVIEGKISTQPGPYTVIVTRAFSVDGENILDRLISAQDVYITDDSGTKYDYTEISKGIFETVDPDFIGEIGRSYVLTVVLRDGRIFESTPETINEPGEVEDIRFEYNLVTNPDLTISHEYRISFDANAGERSDYYFLWKFKATYGIRTNPELRTKSCGESRCPDPPPCSGFFVGTDGQLVESDEPCTCCECWVDFYNDTPIVSDNQLVKAGNFVDVEAGTVPVNRWTFYDKVYVEIIQSALTVQAYDFWKAIKDQKEAGNNIFQPIIGQVPTNFKQIAGDPGNVVGLFYATAEVSKGIFITKLDLPSENIIDNTGNPFREDCRLFVPAFTTNVRPPFWVD